MTTVSATPAHLQVVVMGVSGCGKTTLGEALAQAWGCEYVEGDRYHSPENVARMAAGIALTDELRRDWLLTLADMLGQAHAQQRSLVLSCSALKRSYRDLLRSRTPGLRFVHLHGALASLQQRMQLRQGHYMPASLLNSQLQTLEMPMPDEAVLPLDIDQPVTSLVSHLLRSWGRPKDVTPV
jgi:carbohydrate kinase (thermoresistant glucokinase family)